MTLDLEQPVRRNANSSVVCVYARGPKITHYLGLDGCQLAALQSPNIEFDREYREGLPAEYTPLRFARTYSRDRMIPLSGSAFRVLTAILRGQPADVGAVSSLNFLEQEMAKAKATPEGGDAKFRKPDGPVAQVHAFLDKKLDAVKAGTVSRKELIDAMVEKGLSAGTVTTQCGVWAKTNGITFPRPAQAAEAKKAGAASKRAAKKAATAS